MEAEEAALGSILLSGKTVLEPFLTEVRLRPTHFYRERHRAIYSAMLRLHDANASIDVLTVWEELQRHVEDEDVEPVSKADVDALTAMVPSVGNLREYANRIVELARWRQEQGAAYELLEAARHEDRERRDRALSALMKPDPQAAEVTSTPDQLADLIAAHFSAGEDEVMELPWPKLNDHLAGGLRRGEVTYLGAWTSHGKSVASDQILTEIGQQKNPRTGELYQPWLYINEMTRKQRTCRMLSAMTGVPFAHILRNRMTEQDYKVVLGAMQELPFGMTEANGWSAEEIARDARGRGLDIVGIDILHNIAHNDEADLRRIAGTLQNLAIQGDMHVLCTIHLNTRRLDKQVAPAPTRGDIRGSGMIANLADNVMFVHRAQDERSGLPQDRGHIYFSKVRNGEVGGIGVLFDGSRMRFYVPDGGWIPGQTEIAA